MKKAVRSRLKSIRAAIPQEERAALSSAVCAVVKRLPEFIAADTVLGYCPIGSEPDIISLLENALHIGKKVALPAIEGDCLKFLYVDTLENLRIMSYDIPEPDSDTAAPVTDFSNSICIVPALGLDAVGNRIGYGKGFYDRFLSGYDGVKLGLSFPHTFGGVIPTEPHDVRLDVIVVAGENKNVCRIIRPIKNQIPSGDGI